MMMVPMLPVLREKESAACRILNRSVHHHFPPELLLVLLWTRHTFIYSWNFPNPNFLSRPLLRWCSVYRNSSICWQNLPFSRSLITWPATFFLLVLGLELTLTCVSAGAHAMRGPRYWTRGLGWKVGCFNLFCPPCSFAAAGVVLRREGHRNCHNLNVLSFDVVLALHVVLLLKKGRRKNNGDAMERLLKSRLILVTVGQHKKRRHSIISWCGRAF